MRYVTGDISQAPEMVIIHGCNMQGKMNSGVAKALRAKYPRIYDVYLEWLDDPRCKGKFEPGDYIWWKGSGKIVGNLLTQRFYGYDNQEYATIEAIHLSITSFIDDVRANQLLIDDESMVIATPKIGCGRGGLDWVDVSKVYERIEQSHDVEFVVYDMPDEYSKQY